MGNRYYVYTGSIANAQNLYVLSILNNTAGSVLRVWDMRIINTALSAVTGVGIEFDIMGITTVTGGTAVVPVPAHSADAALGTAIVCTSTSTGVTDGAVYTALFTNNDEVGLTGALGAESSIRAGRNLLMTPLELLKGYGVAVKQITNTTVGSCAVCAVIEFVSSVQEPLSR